jgi:hypothetical protein
MLVDQAGDGGVRRGKLCHRQGALTAIATTSNQYGY